MWFIMYSGLLYGDESPCHCAVKPVEGDWEGQGEVDGQSLEKGFCVSVCVCVRIGMLS